ncbi:hypothetical protein ACSFBI_10800 [Variovorax sp. RB3P1]|uniref:hypothetical protein n=1 Tax=Variovorax sp. RB3P1 TaxID=3443732 RepID=UPI003F4664EA
MHVVASHVQAVISGDAARAEQLMREHVYYAGILLRDNYQRLLDERSREGLPPTLMTEATEPPAS